MFTYQSTTKNKRNRDSLSVNAHEQKYLNLTSENWLLQGSKCRRELDRNSKSTRVIINTAKCHLSHSSGSRAKLCLIKKTFLENKVSVHQQTHFSLQDDVSSISKEFIL